MKKAAILTIGDELLIGQIVDSNSAWIASWLDSMGWQVTRMMSTGDDVHEIVTCIHQCHEAADLVITSGGLGPTSDDLTVAALCKYYGCERIWHEETWQRMLKILDAFHLKPSELHKAQCFVPAVAQVIGNDHGSAPGLFFEKENKQLIAVPGVPNEMRHLLGQKMIHLLPAQEKAEHRFIRTCGQGETAIADLIENIIIELPPGIKIAYLPSFSQVSLRLSAYEQGRVKVLDDLQEKIINRLGDLVYGTGDTVLSQAIGEILRSKRETLALAESCTGGYLSHLITLVPGSSDYFTGAMVSYSNEMKTSSLDIPPDLIARHGAVSEEVVSMMSEQVRKKLNATWSIATSGIAGPGGATPGKPIGTIWIACSGPDGTTARCLQLTRDRKSNIEYTAVAGLVLLWRCINRSTV